MLTFSIAIMLRCVWRCHKMCDAIGGKKRLECKIFTVIVNEQGSDFCEKTSFDYNLKINKGLIAVRFSTQRI